jgi:hypothetical protein
MVQDHGYQRPADVVKMDGFQRRSSWHVGERDLVAVAAKAALAESAAVLAAAAESWAF